MTILHAEEGSPWGAWRARVSDSASLELEPEHGGGRSGEADSNREQQGRRFVVVRQQSMEAAAGPRCWGDSDKARPGKTLASSGRCLLCGGRDGALWRLLE
jgi:hypothetical protein